MKESVGSALKFEAEFFRKSNNLTVVHEKKIRSIQVRSVHVLLLLISTLLVGLTVYKMAQYLLECDALQVHAFRLRNQPVFAKERVRRILNGFGGNILTLDLAELRAQLLQLPEIEDLAISRILPDAVEIGFKLRQPFYQFRKKGVYQLLDAGGLVLNEQQEMPEGLIPIRGDDAASVLQIVSFSGELLPLREKIEYVDYGEPYGIELKLLAVPEVFYPGEKDFIKKINQYFVIKRHLPLNGSVVRYVDLRIAGRIYFECLDDQQGDS